jgi:urea transport system permease protein
VVPAWWEPLRSPVVAVLLILLLPAAVATLLGLAIFRRRVKGAYFAILSQALAAAFAIFLIGQQTTTGGTNGLNGFRGFFGYNLYDPLNKQLLFFIAVTALLIMLVVVWHLYRSRFGELLVAVRDQEERVRFLGYNPANVKLVAYVIAAAMAGIAGALFVPIVGIISPADVGVVPSIAFIIGVAIGGRNTLFGPALGAIVVAYTQTTLSEQFPGFWIYFQGALFVLVVAFLPGGIASLPTVIRRRRRPRPESATTIAPSQPTAKGPGATDPSPEPTATGPEPVEGQDLVAPQEARS